MQGDYWGIVIIGGPILLGIVLIFVIMSNRRNKHPRDIARTEQATRELYEELDGRDKARDGDAHVCFRQCYSLLAVTTKSLFSCYISFTTLRCYELSCPLLAPALINRPHLGNAGNST